MVNEKGVPEGMGVTVMLPQVPNVWFEQVRVTGLE
jgi:hypothetical protein